jgi:hypothetical protein
VIVIFICENSGGGMDRLQGFRLCLCVNVIFIYESCVRGEDILQGI